MKVRRLLLWVLGTVTTIAALFAIAVWLLARTIFAEIPFDEDIAKTVCKRGANSMLLQIVDVIQVGEKTQSVYRRMSFSSGELGGFTHHSGGSKYGNDLDKIVRIDISPDLIIVTVSKEVSRRSPYRFPNPEDGCAKMFREFVSSNEVLSRVLSTP